MIVSFLLTLAASMSAIVPSHQNLLSDTRHLQCSQFSEIVEDSSNVMAGTQVTIFTHGLASSFRDWIGPDTTFDGKIYENHDYLPFKLSDEVYYIDTHQNLLKFHFPDENHYYLSNEGESIDIKQHIVLLYQGINDNEYKSNDSVFDAFHETIDHFLYSIYLQLGVMPKINLIGHSRGGITNLLYALTHPQVVSNLISVGTPYGGTRWAKALDDFEYAMDSKYVSKYKDLYDERLLRAYMRKWNTVKEEYPIDTLAIGCSQTYQFLMRSLLSSCDAGESVINIIDAILSVIPIPRQRPDVKYILESLNDHLMQNLIDCVEYKIYSARNAEFILNFFFPNEKRENMIQALSSLLDVIYRDFRLEYGMGHVTANCCVEIESQLGTSNSGIDFGFGKCHFIYEDYSNEMEAAQPNMPFVLHNLEAKDGRIKDAICDRLFSKWNYLHEHEFSLEKSSSNHFVSCSCGATVVNEKHEMVFQNGVDKGDVYRCKCGYSETRDHYFKYENVTSSGHDATCQLCGLEQLGVTHNLYYRNYNKIEHFVFCDCGYQTTESHFWRGKSNRCGKCGRDKNSDLELQP